jgi:hypothetical protein
VGAADVRPRRPFDRLTSVSATLVAFSPIRIPEELSLLPRSFNDIAPMRPVGHHEFFRNTHLYRTNSSVFGEPAALTLTSGRDMFVGVRT